MIDLTFSDDEDSDAPRERRTGQTPNNYGQLIDLTLDDEDLDDVGAREKALSAVARVQTYASPEPHGSVRHSALSVARSRSASSDIFEEAVRRLEPSVPVGSPVTTASPVFIVRPIASAVARVQTHANPELLSSVRHSAPSVARSRSASSEEFEEVVRRLHLAPPVRRLRSASSEILEEAVRRLVPPVPVRTPVIKAIPRSIVPPINATEHVAHPRSPTNQSAEQDPLGRISSEERELVVQASIDIVKAISASIDPPVPANSVPPRQLPARELTPAELVPRPLAAEVFTPGESVPRLLAAEVFTPAELVPETLAEEIFTPAQSIPRPLAAEVFTPAESVYTPHDHDAREETPVPNEALTGFDPQVFHLLQRSPDPVVVAAEDPWLDPVDLPVTQQGKLPDYGAEAQSDHDQMPTLDQMPIQDHVPTPNSQEYLDHAEAEEEERSIMGEDNSTGLMRPIMTGRSNTYTKWSNRVKPGTLADLMPKLDQMYDGGESRLLMREQEETGIWRQHHVSSSQERLISLMLLVGRESPVLHVCLESVAV